MAGRTGQSCKKLALVLNGVLTQMYEEGQLYSPVTTNDDGGVTVHLAHDHPGANDPAYRARRNEIAAAALAWTEGALHGLKVRPSGLWARVSRPKECAPGGGGLLSYPA